MSNVSKTLQGYVVKSGLLAEAKKIDRMQEPAKKAAFLKQFWGTLKLHTGVVSGALAAVGRKYTLPLAREGQFSQAIVTQGTAKLLGYSMPRKGRKGEWYLAEAILLGKIDGAEHGIMKTTAEGGFGATDTLLAFLKHWVHACEHGLPMVSIGEGTGKGTQWVPFPTAKGLAARLEAGVPVTEARPKDDAAGVIPSVDHVTLPTEEGQDAVPADAAPAFDPDDIL